MIRLAYTSTLHRLTRKGRVLCFLLTLMRTGKELGGKSHCSGDHRVSLGCLGRVWSGHVASSDRKHCHL